MVGSTATQTWQRRLLVRQCVACGYDGALLKGGAAERCARCGCDLRRRPARSYAEMEGLLGSGTLTMPRLDSLPLSCPVTGPRRLLHRWLAFMFFVLMGMIGMAYLIAGSFGG